MKRRLLIGLLGVVLAPGVWASTTSWIGGTNNFNNASNWTNGVPDFADTGVLTSSAPLSIDITAPYTNIGGITFSNTASPYVLTFSTPANLTFLGSGLINQSSQTQIFRSSGTLPQGEAIQFYNSAGIENMKIELYDNVQMQFISSSTVNNSVMENHGGTLYFMGDTLVANSTFTNQAGSAVSPNSAYYGSILFDQNATASNIVIHNISQQYGNGSHAPGQTGFSGNSSAGNAIITTDDNSSISFNGSATASSSTLINNPGSAIYFGYNATGGSATIHNYGYVSFANSATLGSGQFYNNGATLIFDDDSSAGSASVLQSSGAIQFNNRATAGSATFALGAGASSIFTSSSTAGNAVLNVNGGNVMFAGTATGGQSVVNIASGTVSLFSSATAGQATIAAGAGGNSNFGSTSNAGSAIINNTGGISSFYDLSSASNAVVTNSANGTINFSTAASAGNATIINNANGSANFFSVANAGNASITNNTASSIIQFNNASNAGSATLTNNGAGLIQFNNTASGGNVAVVNNGGTFTISNVISSGFTVGSLAGNGSFILGSNSLSVGSNGANTAVSGVISGVGGSLVKVGTGTLTLSGNNTYTGGTSLSGGTLAISHNNNLGVGGAVTISQNAVLQTNAALSSSRNITLSGTGGAINTNGFNSTLSGNIQGAGSLVKAGQGILTVSGSNSYTGGTQIDEGVLKIGSANALPSSSSVVLANVSGAQLDLNNFSQTIGSLSGGGTLGGDVALGSGTLTLGGNNASTTYAGSISGSGTLIKTGSGSLTLTGINVFTGTTTVSGGTLNLTGSLRGDAVIESGAVFSNTGTMGGLINRGTVTPGVNGVGSLTVDRYSGSGTLQILFDGTSFNRLIVNSTATLTGGTLRISGANTSFTSGRYSVITATSVVGTFEAFEAPAHSYFLTIDPDYRAQSVDVVVNALNFSDAAHNPNQRGVATALDANRVSASGSYGTAVQTIYALPTLGEVNQAFNQISGDSLASFQSAGLRGAEAFSGQMNARATPAGFAKASQRIEPVQLAYAGSLTDNTLGIDLARSPAEESGSGYGWWARGLGFLETTDGDASVGSPSSRATTGGFQVGYDFLVAPEVLFGFSAGYANTSLTVSDRSSTGNSNSVQSGVYASYFPQPWFFNGSIAYTSSSNQMSRLFQFLGMNASAGADFQSRSYTTFGEAGYRFQPNDHLSIEPSVSLKQSRLVQEAFTETGNSGLNLTVDERTTNSCVSAMGTHVTRRFAEKSRHPILLGGRVSWQHELNDPNNSITAQFAEATNSPAFTVQGTPRSRNTAALGIDGQVTLTRTLQAFGDYSLTLGTGQQSHGLFGGFRIKW